MISNYLLILFKKNHSHKCSIFYHLAVKNHLCSLKKHCDFNGLSVYLAGTYNFHPKPFFNFLSSSSLFNIIFAWSF